MQRDQPNQVYHAYTTKFDAVVVAEQLDSILGPLSNQDRTSLDEAWHTFEAGLLPWKTHVHLAVADASARIRNQLSSAQRSDIAVSLLLDQSGSMRGQKMLFVAAASDIAQEFLATLGISCEVLGFTTSQWRGGRSRKRWKWRFRPRNPGRLNDLLHIVYKEANDRRASTGSWFFRHMLRPDLPKENVDGEAIEWAVRRLRNLPQTRKLLFVLSDGAPVDDSTLMENGPNYLVDHLRNVVEAIAASNEIELGALGIGFAVQDFIQLPIMWRHRTNWVGRWSTS